MYKNGNLYCENPICKESCPIKTNAFCMPSNYSNINDKNLNICTCLPGWNGDYCNQKVFINFSYISQSYLLGMRLIYNNDSRNIFSDMAGFSLRKQIKKMKKEEVFGKKNMSSGEITIKSKYLNISTSESVEDIKYFLMKQEKKVHSDFMEAIFIYLIYIISVFVIVFLYKFKEDSIIQGINNEWTYKCELESFHF
ncbi:hypothetical protein PIROE2DRAFT_10928 [Piromyces sp. E2]|nr:hypothetical protein PIROE2DRAFT_10928 [Piromyces sp. E2]|eukprot:OUM62719.1 hypothetical protein PIROE2DRAFT_10928 [Piromyces sp. E2]